MHWGRRIMHWSQQLAEAQESPDAISACWVAALPHPAACLVRLVSQTSRKVHDDSRASLAQQRHLTTFALNSTAVAHPAQTMKQLNSLIQDLVQQRRLCSVNCLRRTPLERGSKRQLQQYTFYPQQTPNVNGTKGAKTCNSIKWHSATHYILKRESVVCDIV
jgi:hypothetical protein